MENNFPYYDPNFSINKTYFDPNTYSSASIPTYKDWRDEGVVTKVKDQVLIVIGGITCCLIDFITRFIGCKNLIWMHEMHG